MEIPTNGWTERPACVECGEPALIWLRYLGPTCGKCYSEYDEQMKKQQQEAWKNARAEMGK